jgi:hypothetical protein
MPSNLAPALAVLAAAPLAQATNTWLVDIAYSNHETHMISDPGDTATVEVWAQFDPQWFALANVAFDIDTQDGGNGSWTDFAEHLDGPGSFNGTANADDVVGIRSNQLYYPGEIWPDESNPILVWHGIFTTSDLSGPRNIKLSTITSAFDVWDEQVFTVSVLDSLIEAQADIEVGFPSPGTVSPLALGMLAAIRRHR